MLIVVEPTDRLGFVQDRTEYDWTGAYTGKSLTLQELGEIKRMINAIVVLFKRIAICVRVQQNLDLSLEHHFDMVSTAHKPAVELRHFIYSPSY